jgi:phosphoribosylanthranilate isomerase
MPVDVKICGVNSREAVSAAAAGGARYVGFNFYPPSPRAVDLADAAMLAEAVPADIGRVGLLVDADDRRIAEILAAVPLDILQLHGRETPDRVRAIRETFGLPVMKAVGVAENADLDRATAYCEVADWLLFDAKPPKRPGALPGGNATAFDWSLLAGRNWPIPWMLSGGLTAGNLAAAIGATGARIVDVSSGVEERPGRKSAAKIGDFLAAAAAIRP